MIYFCADDYGLCNDTSAHIKECINKGALNKVSVFPNFQKPDLTDLIKNGNVRLSLHLNLVEGKCMASPQEVNLLADDDGNFRHTFTGLFKLNLFRGKKLEEQLYKEIKAQVAYWKSLLPEGACFCIDSHQHTHMIPSVFRALIRVLEDEKISPEYVRIPAEPMMPFVKTPSLYFTYSPVNVIKQWLLKFLHMCNKRREKKFGIKTAYFFGILFSGKMDEKRVGKVLPKFVRLAEKKNADVEVLFHPGFIKELECNLKEKNAVFEDFYLSHNRKTEYDSVMKIFERSVSE